MHNQRTPIILEGQVYFDDGSNTYLVVTSKVGEMVRYIGQAFTGNLGYRGSMEDIDFIERFQPVDPADLTADEVGELLNLCPTVKNLRVGFIKED